MMTQTIKTEPQFFGAEALKIQHSTRKVQADIQLTSSKSESNRVLIINALTENKSKLENLSAARDTVTMQRLLSSESSELNVLDAGTTMRFLTAFCTVTNRQNTTLTGTKRMQERPIKILVDALQKLGAEIEYLNNDGFPPILIKNFISQNNTIQIRGDISSQYISALLMIAPLLPDGLILKLTGKVGSKPYIQMTLNLMQHFGVQYKWQENQIKIAPQKYTSSNYMVESDWSGASYWYAIASMADDAKISLWGLRKKSHQGDRAIVQIMEKLGVKTEFTKTGVNLVKTQAVNSLEWDFTHCPDLAQTIAVIGAMKGISLKMTGLESLRIKETDRISAIAQELQKFDIQTKIIGDEELHILPNQTPKAPLEMINTYKDHRMAMAFAPASLLFPLEIERPKVVEKSYPSYWEDLLKADFQITTI